MRVSLRGNIPQRISAQVYRADALCVSACPVQPPAGNAGTAAEAGAFAQDNEILFSFQVKRLPKAVHPFAKDDGVARRSLIDSLLQLCGQTELLALKNKARSDTSLYKTDALSAKTVMLFVMVIPSLLVILCSIIVYMQRYRFNREDSV